MDKPAKPIIRGGVEMAMVTGKDMEVAEHIACEIDTLIKSWQARGVPGQILAAAVSEYMAFTVANTYPNEEHRTAAIEQVVTNLRTSVVRYAAPRCDDCKHFMDDPFAPWCLLLQSDPEDARGEGRPCGPKGEMFEA